MNFKIKHSQEKLIDHQANSLISDKKQKNKFSEKIFNLLKNSTNSPEKMSKKKVAPSKNHSKGGGIDRAGRKYIRCFDLGGSGLKTALVFYNRNKQAMMIKKNSSHLLGKCPDSMDVADWVRAKMKMTDGSDLDREIQSGVQFGFSLAGPDLYKLRSKKVETHNIAELFALPEKSVATSHDGNAHLCSSLKDLDTKLPQGNVWNISLGTGVGFGMTDFKKKIRSSKDLMTFFEKEAFDVTEPITGEKIHLSGGSKEGFDKLLEKYQGNKNAAFKEFANRWESFIKTQMIEKGSKNGFEWGMPSSIVFTGGHLDHHGSRLVKELNKRNLGISIFKGPKEAGLLGAAWNAHSNVVSSNPFKDVRMSLAEKLNDIDRVDKIIYDYETLLKKKIPNGSDQKTFEDWMVGCSYFLGSPYYDHNLFFKHLKDHPFFPKNAEFKTAFTTFVKAIQKHTTPLHKMMQTADKVKKIAIMYPGSGGGGHKAPATAMAKELEKQGYQVKLIDSDEYERPYDPKIGGLTRGEIFSKIYQQEGNVKKASEMWSEGNKAQPIEDRKYMKDIAQALRDFKADRLFVVAHHQPEHTSLAYQLGLPTTYVHTDNEFHPNLQDICLNQQEIDSPLVSFTSLSEKSDFYHHLLWREAKKDYSELSEKIKAQMHPMNFPVRESFQPVSKTEKMAIRRKLNLPEEGIVVKLAMGANGIPKDIKEMMNRIKSDEKLAEKPIHVLVVCGSNKELKEELDGLKSTFNTPGAVSFEILGFLNEQEMASFDQASDVWITKPGGSTSAEANQMRKQMLYLPNPHHLWELTNARALEAKNLAEKIDHNKGLMNQIQHRAKIGEKEEYIENKGMQWNKQLANLVNPKLVHPRRNPARAVPATAIV